MQTGGEVRGGVVVMIAMVGRWSERESRSWDGWQFKSDSDCGWAREKPGALEIAGMQRCAWNGGEIR